VREVLILSYLMKGILLDMFRNSPVILDVSEQSCVMCHVKGI